MFFLGHLDFLWFPWFLRKDADRWTDTAKLPLGVSVCIMAAFYPSIFPTPSDPDCDKLSTVTVDE